MTLTTKTRERRKQFAIDIKFIDSLNFMSTALAILIDIKFIDSLNFMAFGIGDLDRHQVYRLFKFHGIWHWRF